MFEWTTSWWFITLVIVVISISLVAGLTRYQFRRRKRDDPAVAVILYNLAAALMTMLALVFIIRWLVELLG